MYIYILYGTIVAAKSVDGCESARFRQLMGSLSHLVA